MKFREMLATKSMHLIVSLPKNDLSFAKAAWDNGADAIKIHLNVGHFASGSSYGSIEQEMSNIKDILETSPVPVGVVLGEGTQTILDDLENICRKNFEFMSVYYDHAPLDILSVKSMVKTVAINPLFERSSLENLKQIGIEALEMSIMPHESYGTLMSVRDLLSYKNIIEACQLPVILPTQKRIKLSDIPYLKKIGVNFLMIGAVVTGTSIDGYGSIVSEYAKEVRRDRQISV